MAQRQTFAQRRLVDLDDADARLFQIHHLITDGQRNLPAGFRARLIVTHEAPLQDGHRAGEHAFHGLLGFRLRKLAPAHGHGLRAADIAENDRRLHAARAIALNPAILGEREAGELFAEILHHVVALKLAMHGHVDTDLILPLHSLSGFFFQEGLVLVFLDIAALIQSTGFAHVMRLRERADGGGRQQRQAQQRLLLGNARAKRAGAVGHVRGDGGHALLHFRIMDSRRRLARCDDFRVIIKCLTVFMAVCRFGEQANLGQFLRGERQPAFQISRQALFLHQIHRTVEQRTARRDHQLGVSAAQRYRLLHDGFFCIQIGFPDIAAINHPKRQPLRRRKGLRHRFQLLRRAHQVHMHPGHRQAGHQL